MFNTFFAGKVQVIPETEPLRETSERKYSMFSNYFLFIYYLVFIQKNYFFFQT